MKKYPLTFVQFHASTPRAPGDIIGYGAQSNAAFRHGWNNALDRLYLMMVDPDSIPKTDEQIEAAEKEIEALREELEHDMCC